MRSGVGGAVADRVVALREPTRSLGLSLADRACLAVGRATRLTVVTADDEWLKLDVGVTVRHIRPRREQGISSAG